MAAARRQSAPAAPWSTKKGVATASIHWDMLKKKTTAKIRIVRGKYLCIVAGAGNGLGRAVSGLAFQDQGIFPTAMAGSKVILIDNDMDALKETSGKKMRQFLMHRKINVELECVDLGDLNETNELLHKIITNNDKDFEHVILINNASNVGHVSKSLIEIDDAEDIQKYWNLNITSRMYVTSKICQAFSHSKRTIVHTANYDSSQTTAYLGLSCIATSAMEKYGEVFAKENPTVRILHYTPNRMDTNRTTFIHDKCGNKELTEELASQYELNTLQNPLEAARKLMKILEDDKFKEGEVLRSKDLNNDNNISTMV